MAQRFLNLACGDFYLKEAAWTNLDWFPHSDWVKKANLLKPLPFPDNHFDVVYTSHFVEHIKRSDLNNFLRECRRVLKSGGTIRIVVPDFENIAREYISNLDAGNQLQAEFNVIEMIDQCVRTTSGGQLSRWRARPDIDSEIKEYVSARIGYKYKSNGGNVNQPKRISNSEYAIKIAKKAPLIYSRIIIKLLPKWFQENHINLTNTGELHRWVYDLHEMQRILVNVGFQAIQKWTAETSSIREFPFFPLDIDELGDPRKGLESMYIEANK